MKRAIPFIYLSIILCAAAVVLMMDSSHRSAHGTARPFTRLIPPAQSSGGAADRCATQGTGCAAMLLAMLNRERAAYGVAPLHLSWRPMTYGTPTCVGAMGHSRHMAEMGTISHDQFPADVCAVGNLSENVGMAMGYSKASAIQTIHEEMMAEPHSPGCSGNHACSIISPLYSQVGIGIVQSGSWLYLTEDFAG